MRIGTRRRAISAPGGPQERESTHTLKSPFKGWQGERCLTNTRDTLPTKRVLFPSFMNVCIPQVSAYLVASDQVNFTTRTAGTDACYPHTHSARSAKCRSISICTGVQGRGRLTGGPETFCDLDSASDTSRPRAALLWRRRRTLKHDRTLSHVPNNHTA